MDVNNVNQAITFGILGKVYVGTGHEGPEEEHRYSALTSVLERGGWSMASPGCLIPGKRPDFHCIGGWVGPRADLNGCGKSRPPIGIRHEDNSPPCDSLYWLRQWFPKSAPYTGDPWMYLYNCYFEVYYYFSYNNNNVLLKIIEELF
jgi:hypothetical protein